MMGCGLRSRAASEKTLNHTLPRHIVTTSYKEEAAMVSRLLVVGLCAATLMGCSGSRGLIVTGTRVGLHAFDGPIAEVSPGLVIKAVSRGQSNDGTLSYEIPGGATCEGKWSLMTKRTSTSNATLSTLGPGSGRLEKGGSIAPPDDGGRVVHASRGAEIYGLGQCSDGATFEFTSIANGSRGRGALRDSHGNIFQIVLR